MRQDEQAESVRGFAGCVRGHQGGARLSPGPAGPTRGGRARPGAAHGDARWSGSATTAEVGRSLTAATASPGSPTDAPRGRRHRRLRAPQPARRAGHRDDHRGRGRRALPPRGRRRGARGVAGPGRRRRARWPGPGRAAGATSSTSTSPPSAPQGRRWSRSSCAGWPASSATSSSRRCPATSDGLRWRTRMRYHRLRRRPARRCAPPLAAGRAASSDCLDPGARGAVLVEGEPDARDAAGDRAACAVTGSGSRADGFWQVHRGRPRDPGGRGAVVRSRLRPGDRVVDLYAGVGLFRVFLAEAVGPQGHVHAVEGDGRRRGARRDEPGGVPVGAHARRVRRPTSSPRPRGDAAAATWWCWTRRARAPKRAGRGAGGGLRAARGGATSRCDPAAFARDVRCSPSAVRARPGCGRSTSSR